LRVKNGRSSVFIPENSIEERRANGHKVLYQHPVEIK
jgi:hypothetical protein